MKPLTPSEVPSDSSFKVKGTVASISADHFTVDTGSDSYSVDFTDATVCEINGEEVTGATDCLAALELNGCVVIKTLDDPAILNILTATKIEKEDASDCSDD